MGLYLRLNKELKRGYLSFVVFFIAPNKLIDSSLPHFLLLGCVYGLSGDCKGRKKEREGIGVPDRTRERKPGSDSSCYLTEPFWV